LTDLFKFLIPAAVVANPVPGFVLFLGSLFVALAALVLWLELVVRAAAVSVAVLFLPLALAALVWPSVAHWCRRLADTLVALILSKLVVAAVLSMAASMVAGGVGVSASGNGGGFASVVTGMAMLFVAILAPFTLLRLVPAVEAGAVAHLESTRHRLKSGAASLRDGGNLALDTAKKLATQPDELAEGSVGTVGAERAAATAGGAVAAGAVAGGTSTITMVAGTKGGFETDASSTPGAHGAVRRDGVGAAGGAGATQPGPASATPDAPGARTMTGDGPDGTEKVRHDGG
jgi:hypothetical protein